MTRIQIVLAALAAVLVAALYWLLLWSPQNTEIADVRAETERLEDQQQTVATQIAQLEAVRDAAPEQEALLAATQSLLPSEAAMPSFLRQVQRAADEAGVTLKEVTSERPVLETVEGAPEGLHRINVAMQLDGSYFQIVDFLRRLEDPVITPRAVIFNALTIGGDQEEYPTLAISLQGDLFAILPVAAEDGGVAADEAVEDEADDDADDAEGADDADDIEIDAEEDAA